jgi:hypothetical protein
MIEQFSRRVFFICLYPCALIVLFLIFKGGPDSASPELFKTAGSLFVIGLAAFLTWFVLCIGRALKKN